MTKADLLDDYVSILELTQIMAEKTGKNARSLQQDFFNNPNKNYNEVFVNAKETFNGVALANKTALKNTKYEPYLDKCTDLTGCVLKSVLFDLAIYSFQTYRGFGNWFKHDFVLGAYGKICKVPEDIIELLNKGYVMLEAENKADFEIIKYWQNYTFGFYRS